MGLPSLLDATKETRKKDSKDTSQIITCTLSCIKLASQIPECPADKPNPAESSVMATMAPPHKPEALVCHPPTQKLNTPWLNFRASRRARCERALACRQNKLTPRFKMSAQSTVCRSSSSPEGQRREWTSTHIMRYYDDPCRHNADVTEERQHPTGGGCHAHEDLSRTAKGTLDMRNPAAPLPVAAVVVAATRSNRTPRLL